ncbi:Ser/Thr protein kinase RdoA involved in Cpx stress response, MazF antagonist [Devosia enhydra]|uniref:Ser/Thr protein kinase RdoA involved in Cpx stress response, MazF antagonist n=1 Tax=Devosia enhydra TaxID=665118 RepID=A0A1K2HUR6_9HYPH|nr:phosphotransferase [Devosia enhydra]SFZ82239.1 Ser/Thr protein kinase RdoA involved in Cpx stress response, MazF antagonist [Devosia enhydra]
MTLPDPRPWLARWPEAAGLSPRLINLSENHTFRLEAEGYAPRILRLHRPGYQSRASIGSELAWLAALARDTTIPLPRVIAGLDGQAIQEVEPDRFAVMFHLEPGCEPQPHDALEPLFETIGAYAAEAHLHVQSWQPPAGFARQVWSAGGVLDAGGLWGDWRAAPHVGTVRATLDAVDHRLRRDLAAYGTGPDRFGLIHADMRLANLLVAPGRTTLIDFDDCGFCWFVYDFAAAISFIETSPQVPALKAAWLRGYARHRRLGPVDLAALDTMVLLRRMALLAWIGSHAETDLARSQADHFAQGTAQLGVAYLAMPELATLS